MMRFAPFLLSIFFLLFLIAIPSCDRPKGDIESYRKLEGLLKRPEMDKVKAVVVIPLENACSSCAVSTLKQLSLLEAKYRGKVQLVLTAKSYRLVDQVMEDMDLSGYHVLRDGNYIFWKQQLVMDSPAYYFLDHKAVVKEGKVLSPEITAFMASLFRHLDES